MEWIKHHDDWLNHDEENYYENKYERQAVYYARVIVCEDYHDEYDHP